MKFDNATLIRFLKDNLPILLRSRDFELTVTAFEERSDLAVWKVRVDRSDVSFDVVLKYFPDRDEVVISPADNESLTQRFSDKQQIMTRVELLYFNKRFDNFLPQELGEATRNIVILENVVKICRFVENKFLEGRLKKCNVMWNDIQLVCEFMFEGNIRGIQHNSWFLSLEYYPQLQSPEELYMVSCDGIEQDDEGMEKEAANLREAISIIEEQLALLPE